MIMQNSSPQLAVIGARHSGNSYYKRIEISPPALGDEISRTWACVVISIDIS
jgi:hypothetical protein